MRHRRRDVSIAQRRRQSVFGHLRRVVGVDQVVRHPRMIRQFRPHLFEDRARLLLIGVGLVRRRRSCNQGERIERAAFPIVGIAQVYLLHRFFIGDGAGAVIDLVIVPVEGCDRRDVIALAIGLLLRGHRLLDRRRPRLQRRRIGRVPQRVPVAHRDAPIAHSAIRLDLGDGGKGLDRLLVPEGVQDPDGLVELLLGGRAAGNRKLDLAAPGRGGRLVASFRNGACHTGNTNEARQKDRGGDSRRLHWPLPLQKFCGLDLPQSILFFLML